MRSFINERESIVSDALDGVILAGGGRLERYPVDHSARVVVRSDWDRNRVAVVSGGGSGHEPSHAGLVGKGLLTAAVCGDVFASPSVDAVLSTILSVTGDAGCLLVIKNYTGDRLNFGLAAEKAKALGLKVETIVVADDVAIPDAQQPRGLAGTLFVHKLAGYLSEQDASLEKIYSAVLSMNPAIRSIGVSRDTCTVPGNERSSRLTDEQVEIGLGIHGEPGVELGSFDCARDLMVNIVARLEKALGKTEDQYAVLFNNLGGLSGLECSILIAEFMKSPIGHSIAMTAGPSSAMTALDMPGFSISLVPLTDELKHALSYRVDAPGWPLFSHFAEPSPFQPAVLPEQITFTPSDNADVRSLLSTMASQCLAMESDINALDAKVGDGDTGSTFAGAARTVLDEMDKLPLNNVAELFKALSAIKTRSMGGSSGVLFAILFEAAGKHYSDSGELGQALMSGLESVKRYGGAAKGDRTMIDALEPAIQLLIENKSLTEVAHAARVGADSTADMARAGAGRSAYLESHSLLGVKDPGAEAIARLLESII